MATGHAVMMQIAPGAAFPAVPPSNASAGISTDRVSAASTPAWVVWNRVPASVMQTVPSDTVMSAAGGSFTENRRVPTAFAAGRRTSPRIAAWRSR